MRLVCILILGLAMLITPFGGRMSSAAPAHQAANLHDGTAATGHGDCDKAASPAQHDCHLSGHSHHPLGRAASVSLVLDMSAEGWSIRASRTVMTDRLGAIDHPPRAAFPL